MEFSRTRVFVRYCVVKLVSSFFIKSGFYVNILCILSRDLLNTFLPDVSLMSSVLDS